MSGPSCAAIAAGVPRAEGEVEGKIELQGVSLYLDFFATRMRPRSWRTPSRRTAYLGGDFCTDRGGHADDIYTTAREELPAPLDVIFRLANERALDLDFHVDENGNEVSKGLRHRRGGDANDFKGKISAASVVAAQAPAELARIIAAAHRSNICVVSLPIVNQWLQNRDVRGLCTPTKRGVTTLKELDDAGVQVCLASDNTRDQFYGYGDLDMLEIFRESCRIGHLDRPIANWPMAVTSRPATVMGLGEHHGRVAVGGPANLVVFRGRCYSELLSRPQLDRLVLRDGRPLMDDVPTIVSSTCAELVPINAGSRWTWTRWKARERGRTGDGDPNLFLRFHNSIFSRVPMLVPESSALCLHKRSSRRQTYQTVCSLRKTAKKKSGVESRRWRPGAFVQSPGLFKVRPIARRARYRARVALATVASLAYASSRARETSARPVAR